MHIFYCYLQPWRKRIGGEPINKNKPTTGRTTVRYTVFNDSRKCTLRTGQRRVHYIVYTSSCRHCEQ